MGELTRREATKAIANGMSGWLPKSFIWSGSKERFTRDLHEKTDYLYVAVWTRLGRHIFGMTPAVAIPSVNDLRRKVLGTRSDAESTVTAQLWSLEGKSRPQVVPPLPGSESEYHWEFETTAELAIALKNCQSLYYKLVEPFFDSIRTQKDAHRALNEESIDYGNDRLLNGLLAATLESEADWKRVVDKTRHELSDWLESDQARYESIISKLDMFRQNQIAG